MIFLLCNAIRFKTLVFLPNFEYKTEKRLTSLNITEEDILDIILTLNVNKSNGWDNISVKMVKICGDSIVYPLLMIFKDCLNQGVYPSFWKKSNICPIHKKESKNLIKNYRPISLLPVFDKIFEKIIHDAMYNYFTSNDFFTKFQSGFKKGDSCVLQLLAIVHNIYKNLDNTPSTDTCGFFLDMSKAFDKVWHDGLIFKLKMYGIEGNLLSLIKDYLSMRQQRVTINGKSSSWKSVLSGVPQGSVLGPLLFLIYINDLPDHIKSTPYLFADDVSLFTEVKDCTEATDILNNDLLEITKWSFQWKMQFNPDINKQATEVCFSNKRVSNALALQFNDNVVNSVVYHKHLGLILDDKLSFEYHVNEKITKANHGIAIIKSLFMHVPRKSLINIYKSFVRPHLDYCDVIYHKPTDNYSRYVDNISISNMHFVSKIESVQYNAALAISGCIRGTSREKIYNELGLMSLHDRRTFHRLTLFYKIRHKLVPSYLNDLMPETRPSNYNFRSHQAEIYPTRTNKFRYSFFPHCVRMWNNLSKSITLSPSLEIFKNRYLIFFEHKPSNVYFVHNPLGLKLLTRLRVGLSHLRSHKYNHGFLDTPNPLCLCNKSSIETTEHYLLICPIFSQSRKQLFIDLSSKISIFPLSPSHLTSLLLYGHESHESSINKFIIETVLIYLLHSKRFEGPLF